MSLRHGPKHTGSGLNDDVWNQLEKIADVSRKLAQRIRTPTHPVYDSTNFPPNATRGQIVRDVNDPDILWVYGEDDVWHKIGSADVPWAAIVYGPGFGADLVIPSGQQLVVPFDFTNPGASRTDFLTNNDGIYEPGPVGPTTSGIHFKDSGTYAVIASARFANGPAYDINKQAGVFVTTGLVTQYFSAFLNRGSEPFILGVSHPTSLTLISEGTLAYLKLTLSNAAGQDLIFSDATMFVIRLSAHVAGFTP